MPLINDEKQEARHSDDIEDIITAVPRWLLRWGITLFFSILMLLLGISAFIKYPDIVKTQLKISSPNMAKHVVSKISGKLVKLLVENNNEVSQGQSLAYIESTANHNQVLQMIDKLKKMQKQFSLNRPVKTTFFNSADYSELGELQASFQSFSEAYITYKSSVENGFWVKKRGYLQKDLLALYQQETQLKSEEALQNRDLKLAEEEYKMHMKLEQQKVETPAELRQQESKYLSRKTPMLQTKAALISATTNSLAKQKEILEFNNQVHEVQAKFFQALNSLISNAEDWKTRYVLSASQAGKLTYAGIIQENQVINVGQDVFYINASNEQFFGEMSIPQDNLGKVKEGQEVLIKLRGYPFEEYGMLTGRISYLPDVPFKDSIFISKVTFREKISSDQRKPLRLKQGMMADAEIITQDATILQRLSRNIIKAINSK